MEISRVDTTAYSDSNVTTGQKTNDNQASNKTYKNEREYKQYLTEKNDCLRNKECEVSINSSLLSEAMGNEKVKEWLEYNLSIIPKCIEKTKALVESRGAKVLYHSISIDGYDSISSQVCSQYEADPGTEKARKELNDRIEKRREDKKAEQKRLEQKEEEERKAEKLEEKRQENLESQDRTNTFSVCGTDMNDLSDKMTYAIAAGRNVSGVIGFDAKV